MNEPDFTNPDLVARLVDSGFSGERIWDASELRDVVAHQLAGPIVADLKLLGSAEALEAAQLCSTTAPAVITYAELFAHPSPPRRLLELVAQYALAQLVAPEPLIPIRVARRLYFTATAVARVRCGGLPAVLVPKEMAAGITWLLGEPWVDEQTRATLLQALEFAKGDARPPG